MMSMKWTFSFLTLMLVGLLIATPALANKITLRIKDANHTGEGAHGEPADISAEDGIQVFAGTHAMIKLTSEEPLVTADVMAAAFELVGSTIATTAGITRVNASEYTIALAHATGVTDSFNAGKEVTIYVVPGKFASATTGSKDSSAAMLKFKYVAADSAEGTPTSDGPNNPTVISITRATAIGSTIASAFVEEVVTGEFMVKIVLSEKPNGGLASAKLADRIKALSVSAGTVTNVVPGVSFERADNGTDTTMPPPSEGGYATGDTAEGAVPQPTGRDAKYYPYLATIVPDGSKDEVIIQVNDFNDLVLTQGEGNDIIEPGMYRKPSVKAAEGNNGRQILKVKVKKGPAAAKTAGLTVGIPDGIIIPAGGYLVVAKDDGDGDDNHEKRTDSTAVVYPGDPTDDEILVGDRQPAQRLYNVIKAGLPNLETFLSNGGTIVLIGPSGLVISEIMWGTDASLADSYESQWIEIMNPGAQVKTKGAKLVFYGSGASDKAALAALDAKTVADTVGTVGASGYWSIAGKGQSGRSGIDEAPGDIVAVAPTQAIISMQRVIAAGVAADGTMASNWAASVPPGQNFNLNVEGTRVGSPGASPAAYPVAPTPEPEPAPAPVVPPAMAGDIAITEIMVDMGSKGLLPQWIELTNVSGAEKSLAGWSVEIENAAGSAIPKASIKLSGTLGIGTGMGMGGTQGKSLLLVAFGARSSPDLSKVEDDGRLINVSGQLEQRGRYTLLNEDGFMIELLPPQTTGILQFGDTAGNLDADEAWELPEDRASLIRVFDNAMPAGLGTDESEWTHATDTSLLQANATLWYGSDEDSGTPGVTGGGPLPVELSHFRPARDKATGAVVITWATQSELNNAGFFIKRSNQRDGQFQVVNATMVPGAGTTSEKQFYTYTDTTAQPNIVYYYQIEDVSLDGNRQTLTRGIRLKGHIGAAGKLTSTWGELKSSNE